MRLIRNPAITIPIDSEDYSETYAKDENGNTTDELVPYVYQEEGVFAIDTVKHSGLTEYKGTGTFSTYAGVKTYCYQWPDMDAYEQDFPPVEPEESPPAFEPEPSPYDLETGKAIAVKILLNTLDDRYAEAISGYPLFETMTWDKQRLEAAGEMPATIIKGQLLDGESESELKEKVSENSLKFSELSAHLIKIRRQTERAINNAQNEKEINNILGGL